MISKHSAISSQRVNRSIPPLEIRGKWAFEAGFTIVELMITMALFVFVLAAASGIFTNLLAQFKQQSKITETNTEGIIGLEILRRDTEHAGYGLPRVIPIQVSYNEASATPAQTYNDCSGSAPCSPPRAIVSKNNVSLSGIVTGTDYLVIKAINVATNSTCQKSTSIVPAAVTPFSNTSPGNPRKWDNQNDAFSDGEYVIVLSMSSSSPRQLVNNASAFSIPYSFGNVTSVPWAPTDPSDTRLIYGVDPSTSLRMPFNRADFFVSTSNVPQKCASNTGVLVKVVVNQSDGKLTNYMPLLDCVADMQVVYSLDMDNNGQVGTVPLQPPPANHNPPQRLFFS